MRCVLTRSIHRYLQSGNLYGLQTLLQCGLQALFFVGLFLDYFHLLVLPLKRIPHTKGFFIAVQGVDKYIYRF